MSVLQTGQIPVVRVRILRARASSMKVPTMPCTISENRAPSDPRLRATARRMRVDRLALLVHHVVVFEQVFARREVLRLHRLLRRGDALGDQLRSRSAHLLPCRAAASGSACARRRRCAADRPGARGRTASCRDRPAGPRVRAAGCRCAGTRAARCRRMCRPPERDALRRARASVSCLILARRRRLPFGPSRI